MVTKLTQLGYKVKNIDDIFPDYLKSRVPAEIIVNHYSVKIISAGSSVNFNYSNLPEIKNVIDLGIYNNQTGGVDTFPENEENTKILADLYTKLNNMTLNQINIYY